MRCLLFVMSALLWSGCGYVGEPLTPALRIPARVTDLSAIERGSQIVVTFTLPTHTTEGLVIKDPVTFEVGVGTLPNPFQVDVWAAGARISSGAPPTAPTVRQGVPAGEWIDKFVLAGVKITAWNGRSAGWSNLVPLSIVAPLAQPENLHAEGVSTGVRLTWQGSAPRYRIYRRVGAERQSTLLGETDHPEYTDPAEYGTAYHYSVEAMHTGGDIHAFSEVCPEVGITPIDRFPPAVPAGLKALSSTNSIELVWDRDTEPDLAGYRIYRAQGSGAFEKLAETQEVPSYSDHQIEAGKTYRYAVSAFDKLGNESEKSRPVEISAQ